MNKRHVDLARLGFTLDGESYYLYKWGNQYWMDLTHISDYSNKDWEYYIEDVKQDFRESEIAFKSDKNYIAGTNFAEKQFKQKILNELNKYRSWLQQETQCKTDRSPNFKRETELKAKVEVLKELIKYVDKQ